MIFIFFFFYQEQKKKNKKNNKNKKKNRKVCKGQRVDLLYGSHGDRWICAKWHVSCRWPPYVYSLTSKLKNNEGKNRRKTFFIYYIHF